MTGDRSGEELPPELVRQRLLRQAQQRNRRDLAANYRDFLAPVVTAASPLLIDVCRAWVVDLPAMVARLRPPPGWPGAMKGRSGWTQRPPRATGRGVAGRQVQVVVTDDALNVRTWIGDAFASTRQGVLQLWLMDRLPETVQDGFVGRELATVIDHRLLRMRPYRIIRSRSIGSGTVVEAEAPTVPYRLPWV